MPLSLWLMSESSVNIDQHSNLTCFHCGEDCPDDRVHIEEKYFCCEGCKMVYEILNTHQLTHYYQIEGTPGREPQGRETFTIRLA